MRVSYHIYHDKTFIGICKVFRDDAEATGEIILFEKGLSALDGGLKLRTFNRTMTDIEIMQQLLLSELPDFLPKDKYYTRIAGQSVPIFKDSKLNKA
jgi:hypothetical protein